MTQSEVADRLLDRWNGSLERAQNLVDRRGQASQDGYDDEVALTMWR